MYLRKSGKEAARVGLSMGLGREGPGVGKLRCVCPLAQIPKDYVYPHKDMG